MGLDRGIRSDHQADRPLPGDRRQAGGGRQERRGDWPLQILWQGLD